MDFPYPSRVDALNHGSIIDNTQLLTDEDRKMIYIENVKATIPHIGVNAITKDGTRCRLKKC